MADVARTSLPEASPRNASPRLQYSRIAGLALGIVLPAFIYALVITRGSLDPFGWEYGWANARAGVLVALGVLAVGLVMPSYNPSKRSPSRCRKCSPGLYAQLTGSVGNRITKPPIGRMAAEGE